MENNNNEMGDDFFEQNKQDFSNIIVSKSLSIRIDTDAEIISSYSNLLWYTFFELNDKLLEVPKLNYEMSVIHGINLIDNLFWYIFNYSLNLQLTLFLAGRGKLLYTEYLIMSRTHQLMKQFEKCPTIHDAYQFAVKRSIGTLTSHSGQQHRYNNKIQMTKYRQFYRHFFALLNTKIIGMGTGTTSTASSTTKLALILQDYCKERLIGPLTQFLCNTTNHEWNTKILSMYTASDFAQEVSINGFLFTMELLLHSHANYTENSWYAILGFINTHSVALSSITLTELNNKAHYLAILWETTIICANESDASVTEFIEFNPPNPNPSDNPT